MTADEYLTLLAEIDAGLAKRLRADYMWAVESTLERFSPEWVLVRVKNMTNHAAVTQLEYKKLDPLMDDRLEWFK